MKRGIGFVVVVALAVAMCWGATFFSPSEALAREVVVVEGAKFDTSNSLADNLKNYMGKDVFVHLKSGEVLQGYVKAVGNNLIHLEKLKGKDFYDALIRLEEITAMEARFREMK